MLITDEEKVKIVEFFNAVDDMIDGRFILSDTKVSNILKAVVKSEALYNLYSKCMQNFKFASMLDRCKSDNPSNGGYFTMPDEEKDIVAFVTCFLLEVDKKNINLQTFITDNFYSNDGYNISYNNFALTVLIAYKSSVQNLLGVDENGNVFEDEELLENQISIDDEEKVEADQNTKILFANLVMNINELYNAINDDYKIKMNEKEELLIVLKALNKAIHLEELLLVNALLIPLEHTIVRYKKLKPIYENIKLLIADIYY